MTFLVSLILCLCIVTRANAQTEGIDTTYQYLYDPTYPDKNFSVKLMTQDAPSNQELNICRSQSSNILGRSNPIPLSLQSVDYVPGSFGKGCTDDRCPEDGYTKSKCTSNHKDSYCGCNPSQSYMYSSCSCNGRCIEVNWNQRISKLSNYVDWNEWIDSRYHDNNNNGAAFYENRFFYWNQKPKANTWTTCYCHDDFFGERCQFKKSDVPITSVIEDSTSWAKHLPFLPLYNSSVARDIFYDEKREYAAIKGNTTIELERWAGIRTLVETSDFQGTVWGWSGLKHQCPFEMVMNGIWHPVRNYLTNWIPAQTHSYVIGNPYDAGRLDYSQDWARSRLTFFCECIVGSRSACSNHGKCVRFKATEDNIFQFSDGRWYGRNPFSVPANGKRISYLYKRVPTFMGGDITSRIERLDKFVYAYNRCECDDEDYQGLYCEKDVRAIQRCGDGVTSYGQRTAPIDGTAAPNPCLCDSVTSSQGQEKLTRTTRYGDKQPTGVCVRNLHHYECGDKGFFNNFYSLDKVYIGNAERRERDLRQCECFQDGDKGILGQEPTEETYQLLHPPNAGPGCKTSCREFLCNNRGNCKYRKRDQDPPFKFYGQPHGRVSAYVLDTTGCDCDPEFEGAFCGISKVGGLECDERARPATEKDEPCADRCLASIGDSTFFRPVLYNKTSARCQVYCGRWVYNDPSDPTGVPNGLECGGPKRGVCQPVNEKTASRDCDCHEGFDGVACEKVLCPTFGGVACAGIGTCNTHTQTCECPSDTYGHACELKRQDLICHNNAQPTYNGETWRLE